MEKTKPDVRKNVPDKSLTRAAIKSNTESAPSLALTRRRFLGSVSGVTAATLATGAAGLTTLLAPAQAGAAVDGPDLPAPSPVADDEGLRGMVFDVLVKQLGHRPSEAAQLITSALGRRPGVTTPEELFDEIYRGSTR